VELAAITVALDLHKNSPRIQILTDNAFSINMLRNYAIDHSATPTIPTKNSSAKLTHSSKLETKTA